MLVTIIEARGTGLTTREEYATAMKDRDLVANSPGGFYMVSTFLGVGKAD